MPGTHLNDTERHLLQWWDAGNPQLPVLTQLSIHGTGGLRGIKDLDVRIKYPLTAFCGRNGNGKTTLLALAALAFGGYQGHVPPNAFRKPRRGELFTYYTFRDFFFRGPADSEVADVAIQWTYRGTLTRQDGRAVTSPIEIRKRSSKWMHYERRPSKPVYYLGVSRSLPAIEQRALRSQFGASARRRVRRRPLTDPFRLRLGEIMGRPYDTAETLSTTRYAVRSAGSGGSSFSSFNMGAGEDVLIEILNVLQEAPSESLIVIEEVELGLHPEAVRRLAKHLQEVMDEKHLQVFVSTHSREFLDAIPRVARVLVQRNGEVHEAIHGPTSRYASGVMAGQPDAELIIYCEDGFSELVIGASLTTQLRPRVKIIPVGSDAELMTLAFFHQKAQMGELGLLVWDGEVTDAKIVTWKATAVGRGLDLGRVNWMRLGGAGAPERWVLDLLNCQPGIERLASALKDTIGGAQALITALEAVQDPHEIPRELAMARQLRVDEAEMILVREAAQLDEDPFAPVRTRVQRVLDGQAVQEPGV